MSVRICGVVPGSMAEKKGIVSGDHLLTVSGHPIRDILDYQFYATDPRVVIELLTCDGKHRKVRFYNREYEDLGLLFESYLMDRQQSCRNKCIFCFIDQLPKGMRESLYFKDDDERLSFLFGNYVTLTNLTDDDVDRIIRYHISPINVSVHTTDPELRVYMMKNPRAAEILPILLRLAKGGISLNCQLVLCPGINDGKALEKSLMDLELLLPQLQSVACVPVGLSDYRDGLEKLNSFTKEGARAVLSVIDKWNQKRDAPVAFASDEFYLLAEKRLPPAAYYGDFPQLENGVGMCTYLEEQVTEALKDAPISKKPISVSVATGVMAAPFISQLLNKIQENYPNLVYTVYSIENHYFGSNITVSGLLTGKDILEQLRGKPLGNRLLLPCNMLDNANEKTLDDMTPDELSQALGISLRFVENDGWDFIDAVTETAERE